MFLPNSQEGLVNRLINPLITMEKVGARFKSDLLWATLANRGKYLEPVAILKVEDKNNKVMDEVKERKSKQVIDEDIAFLISHILSDNNARSDVFGPSSLLNISGKTVAVKTGTTDDKRDNWTIGYTPSFLVVVWVGNNDNTPMNPEL